MAVASQAIPVQTGDCYHFSSFNIHATLTIHLVISVNLNINVPHNLKHSTHPFSVYITHTNL